jgi:signal transduction histidine kinase
MSIPPLSTLDARVRDLATYAACAIGMGVIYFLACHIALSIDITDGAASVWPASGLLFGALLLTPNRLVPPVLIGALIGGIVANLGVGFDAVTSIGYSCINLGEGVMGRWLVRRYWPDAPRLSHPQNLFALIACGAGAAVAGAMCAATLASVTAHASWMKVLGTWAGSDAAGIVIITPVILATASALREVRGPIPRWRIVEAIVLLTATIGAAYWLYLSKQPSRIDQLSNPLVIVPLMGWAAIRFEAPGAAWAIFIVNTFCIWGTTTGSGPLFDVAASSLVNLVIQARVGVTGMVALSLGTAVGAARRSAGVHERLALELQAAVDAERARLSHELHDEVAQKLAALKMHLQLSEIGRDGGTASSTASSVAIVDELLADVRSLSYSLRPAPFDQGQLVPALTALARVEGVRGGVRVLIQSPAAELSLPRDIELVCYRVVREAVSNAVKHACARNVAVSLSCHLDRLTFSIMDDGRGFDVAPTTRRERLGRVGGTLSISSRLGAGTTINCLVPLGAGV